MVINTCLTEKSLDAAVTDVKEVAQRKKENEDLKKEYNEQLAKDEEEKPQVPEYKDENLKS